MIDSSPEKNPEKKEPVQRTPFRVLISKENSSDSANLIDEAINNINVKNGKPVIESVRVKDPQSSLDVLGNAEKDGSPFGTVIVPGRKNLIVVGRDLLVGMKREGINNTRVVVLTTSPEVKDYFDPNDIKSGKVVVVNRYDVIQKGDMEKLLNAERERQQGEIASK